MKFNPDPQVPAKIPKVVIVPYVNRYLFPLGFDDLWRDRQSIKLGSADITTLSLEHAILFLCAHGAKHAWFRLFWLNDVARIITKNDAIDWNILMRHSVQLGIHRMVAEGVLLANVLLGCPLPESARFFAEKDGGVNKLCKRALYLILHPDEPFPKPFTYPYFFSKLHESMLRTNLFYKLAFCSNLIGSKYSDWNRVPLPDALFSLYCLLRPLMWFFRWYVPRTRVYREGPMGRRKDVAT